MTEPRPSYMRLPYGESDDRKRYTLPDPDVMADAITVAHHHIYNGEREPSTVEWGRVIAMADAYRFLTTHVLGQEHCVEKLRDVWRARRALEQTEEGDVD